MDPDEVKLKRKIIKARQSIKRKFEALKRGEVDTMRFAEQVYKPIIDPIKELVQEKKHKKIKIEKQEVEKHEAASEDVSLNVSGGWDYGLSKEYTTMAMRDTTNSMDHQHGVYYNPDRLTWYIGNKEINFIGDDFTIDDESYTGTRGLFELLFKKDPVNYDENDLHHYKEILIQTSAHKRQFNQNRQLRGSKSSKYMKIIKPLFTSSGAGLIKEVNSKSMEYVYWNTPSELVQRLMLLYASKQAGNTSHQNEITSIIEELREAEIIA